MTTRNQYIAPDVDSTNENGENCKPSTVVVAMILDLNDEWLTTKEIANRAHISIRTARAALNRIDADKKPDPIEPRRSLYTLNND